MGQGVLTTGFRRAPDGALQCEGVPIEKIAADVGTPVYVYSAGTIRDRYEMIDATLAPVPHRVHYTLKANANGAILRLLRELGAGADHVRVHAAHPVHEGVQVGGVLGLGDAMDVDAVAHLVLLGARATAREHVDLDVLVDQRLRELADMPRQPALHDRRVLPGQRQDAHRQGADPIRSAISPA